MTGQEAARTRGASPTPDEGSVIWTERGLRRVCLGVLVGLTAARLAYLASGAIDLSADEAHYWEWSRRLDLSYYSKGPLIAYLIRLLTAIGGTSVFAIRVGAVALSLVGAWALVRLARDAFGDARPGFLAVIGLQLTPLVWAGSLLLTIDAPFMACWTLALWAFWRAVRGLPGGWLAAGLFVGLGLLAKYAMLFALPGLGLYLARAPEVRVRLSGPRALAGAALALALFAPVVAWNLTRDWPSLRHVVAQGTGGGGLTPGQLVELLASQIGVLTPLMAAFLGWGAWYGLREGLGRGREPYRFLAAFAWPVLAFYGALALQGKVQANWPAAAYPPLALLAAGGVLERWCDAAAPRRATLRRLLIVSGALAVLVSALGHVTDRLGVPPRLDPTTRLRGWRELGVRVAALRGAMPDPARTFLVSDRYQVTSELAFYVPGSPPAYNLNLGRRLNQYDFWEGPDARRGWDAVYVEEGARPLDPRVRAAFARIEGPIRIEIDRGGRPVRRFSAYRGYDFRGMAPLAEASRY